MQIGRISLFMLLGFCAATIYGMFAIKHNVMALRGELKEVKKQIEFEQDTIHILKAEFAYLTSPQRIRMLAETHLGLKETKVSQLIKDPALYGSDQQQETKQIASSERAVRHVKWRYKSAPRKYVTQVSGRVR